MKRRVKKAGPLRGTLGPPGDIDVLVVSRKKRTVFLVECKDLALARTPREMANEFDALFRGGGKRKSTVELHLARKRWAEGNLRALLGWIGVGWSKKWKVEALLVLDHRPMTARLAASPIPVVSVAEIVEFVSN